MNARPLAQGDSELTAQHQDLGVLPPRLPPGQAQHRHGTGDNEEVQIQAHKPKIIARPPACKSATNRHARALTLRPPRRVRPVSIRFRHPQVKLSQSFTRLESLERRREAWSAVLEKSLGQLDSLLNQVLVSSRDFAGITPDQAEPCFPGYQFRLGVR